MVGISMLGFQPFRRIESLIGQRCLNFVGPGRWILPRTWCALGVWKLLLAGLAVVAVVRGSHVPALRCNLGAVPVGIGCFHWFCGINRRGRLDWIYLARLGETR